MKRPHLRPHVSRHLPKHCLAALCCAGLFAPAAFGQMLELAQSKNCVACHQLEKRMIGPPFAAIAARFHGQKQGQGKDAAIALLSMRIRQGSRWQWGALAMPRQDDVSQEEAERLAAWILSLAGENKGNEAPVLEQK